MVTITKRQLRAALFADTGQEVLDVDISRFFRITQTAVSYWGEDEPIPEKRALQAALWRPDLFGLLSMPAANDDTCPAHSPGAVDGEG